MDLNELAEELEDIGNFLLEQNPDLHMVMSGSTNYVGVHIECPLWDSECDDRTLVGDAYTVDIPTYILSKLEQLGENILRAVERAVDQEQPEVTNKRKGNK